MPRTPVPAPSTPMALVEAARADVARLKSEIARIETAPVDVDTALDRAARWVDHHVRGMDPFQAFTIGREIPGAPAVPEEPALVHVSRNGDATTSAGASIKIAEMIFGPAEVRQIVAERVRALYAEGGPLAGRETFAPADRKATLARLRAELLQAEREEEAAIEEAEAAGITIPRRGDTDPVAVLGLAE